MSDESKRSWTRPSLSKMGAINQLTGDTPKQLGLKDGIVFCPDNLSLKDCSAGCVPS